MTSFWKRICKHSLRIQPPCSPQTKLNRHSIMSITHLEVVCKNSSVGKLDSIVVSPVSMQSDFYREFLHILRCRDAFRRFAPTPELFPLFCAMLKAVGESYKTLPSSYRNAPENRYLSFTCYGRQWYIRRNCDLAIDSLFTFIDICTVNKKTLVTIGIQFDADSWSLPEASSVFAPLDTLARHSRDDQ